MEMKFVGILSLAVTALVCGMLFFSGAVTGIASTFTAVIGGGALIGFAQLLASVLKEL